jgi:ubiquinone/menaquinone biosynthesis C-methylase UbiE
MLRTDFKTRDRGPVTWVSHSGNRIKHTPWIGDLTAGIYDRLMASSVFPKKFEADIVVHRNLIGDFLKNSHSKQVLELATGSGSITEVLPADNIYTGTDISPRLLKIAGKKLEAKGFKDSRLYICDVGDLPFMDRLFDICICNLSFNFFPELERTVAEIHRVLKKDGIFFGSVPVPELIPPGSNVRGKLYSKTELADIFIHCGFQFTGLETVNGCLFYFRGTK